MVCLPPAFLLTSFLPPFWLAPSFAQKDCLLAPSSYNAIYECNIMPIQEDTFRCPALPLFALNPNLSDATEHHIEEVIEAQQSAGELTLALHDHPYGVVDALIQHAQRHDF